METWLGQHQRHHGEGLSLSKPVRKPLAIAGILVLLAVIFVGALPSKSSAATLSSGSYTFLVDGEEVMFPFDPVARKDGLLFPVEIFARFGVTAVEAPPKTVTLAKGSDAAVVLTVGSTAATINGKAAAVATMPLRLAGRLFLPADVLKEFGVETIQDGTTLLFRTSPDNPAATTRSDADWSLLKSGRVINASVKSDSGVWLTAEFTFLTPDIVKTTNLGLSYGTRARLLSYLQTNTLILVKLSNYLSKAGALVTAGLSLVDLSRNEYDLSGVLDIGSGLVNTRLAPGADRTGVLVFPKVQPGQTQVLLYYDTNGGNVGAFINP